MNVRCSAVLSYDDMLGYAVIGLVDAVEKFDLSRDVKFETYAMVRIRGAVLDGIKSMDWLPRSVRASSQELRRVLARLEGELGHPPSDIEVAGAMEISLETLEDLWSQVGQPAMLSLEELLLYGEESPAGNGAGVLADESFNPVIAAEQQERGKILAHAIGQLPEREKLVVSLYYKEGLTLKEIAQVLGVTESRACQLHSKAVMRLNGKLARHADLMLSVA
jgi:RNA polymerase sigma factor for flagellar operon FliA